MNIAVSDKYMELLMPFGDVQMAIELALQRYLIEQITAKIQTLRQREAIYRAQYGLDYHTFVKRIATDESFVQHTEQSISKLWEIDLADWEFCQRGIADWTQKLHHALLI